MIPVFNRSIEIFNLIDNILEQSYIDFRVIIVDHSENKIDFSRIASDKILIKKADDGLWWTGAINVGLSDALSLSSENDLILLMNDDTEIEEGYFKSMVDLADQLPDTIIGSLCVDSISHRIIYANRILNRKKAKYISPFEGCVIDQLPKVKYITSDILYGRGLLIPKKVFQKIGIFDEDRLPHYGADSEFTFRAKKEGYNLVCSISSIVKTPSKKDISLRQNLLNKRTPGNLLAMLNYSFLCFNFPYAVYYSLANSTRKLINSNN